MRTYFLRPNLLITFAFNRTNNQNLNIMKKTILMFAAAGLLLATPSCKKGENDPAMSLSSRTARVAGEWTITGYESTSRTTDDDGDWWENTSTLNGTDLDIDNTYHDGSDGSESSSTTPRTLDLAEFTFEKDGTFSAVWNTTTTYVSSYTIGTYTQTTTTVETSTMSSTGNWSFLGKVKDSYKNKERMILNTLTVDWKDVEVTTVTDNAGSNPVTSTEEFGGVESYTSGEWQETWDIDQLKGKEMIVKTESNNSGTSSYKPDGGSTTTTQNDINTSMTTITLTHK